MNAKFHLPPLVMCPSCGQPNDLDAEFADKHFRGEDFVCIRCGATSDRYLVARKTIEEHNPLGVAMGLVGARSTYFEVRLEPNQGTVYRYSAHEIPEGARILSVNYTSRRAVGDEGAESGGAVRRARFELRLIVGRARRKAETSTTRWTFARSSSPCVAARR